MTCRNKTSWPGFGSIPATGAIFVKIGDGPVPGGHIMDQSLVHALLRIEHRAKFPSRLLDLLIGAGVSHATKDKFFGL